MVTLDPALAAFLPWVVGLFAVIGTILLLVTPFLRGPKPALLRELWLRYVSWGVLAAGMLGALAAGRVAWILLVALLSAIALREFTRAVGLWLDRAYLALGYLFIAAVAATAVAPNPAPAPELGWYGLFVVLPAYGTVAVLTVPVLRGRYEGMLQRIALAILGTVYVAWFLGHYAYLVNLQPDGAVSGVGLVLFITAVTALNDVGAYNVGKLLGRHKMRPHLSPGKTWEGAAGSVGVVLAASFGLWFLVPFYTSGHLLVVALLLAVGSTIGDLALSTIKRDLGIKDWGETLPGHGGMLDRLNSILFTAPIFFHYTRFFFQG